MTFSGLIACDSGAIDACCFLGLLRSHGMRQRRERERERELRELRTALWAYAFYVRSQQLSQAMSALLPLSPTTRALAYK
eukprot:COSAG06_NODE_17759_length_922_cov_102.614824_1_plen_79_part_10